FRRLIIGPTTLPRPPALTLEPREGVPASRLREDVGTAPGLGALFSGLHRRFNEVVKKGRRCSRGPTHVRCSSRRRHWLRRVTSSPRPSLYVTAAVAVSSAEPHRHRGGSRAALRPARTAQDKKGRGGGPTVALIRQCYGTHRGAPCEPGPRAGLPETDTRAPGAADRCETLR
ncbi:unnamed protein product, partial [Pleuronectes platessa]